VTTLSVTNAKDNGDLYFAFSQTSNATGQWNVYKFPDVCSNTQNGKYPAPDQPVLGYNQNWAAVDIQCYGAQGIGAGSDQLILVPSSVLTQNPAPSSLSASVLTPPFFGARPSRDISGGAGQNLFLVGSFVPSSSSLPSVQVTSVDASGNIVGADGNHGLVYSPGNGVPGTFGNIAAAQHDTCGAGSACAVSLQDARIANVVLQKGDDGHEYLLTSFHAGDSANSTSQALWFVGQVDTFQNLGSAQWNISYVDGPGWWAGYPTITMDSDVGIAATFQSFYLNSNIYPNWYINKGFTQGNGHQPGQLLGYGILANAYRGAYAGCAGLPTRWGDYMSTIWDQNLPAPAGSNGFWTVQEYSNGGGVQAGSNQSTQITELASPLPYYVSYSANEQECNVGVGNTCDAKFSAPAGLRKGDVVVAFLDMGGSFPKPPTPPDSWTELPIANNANAVSMQVGSCGAHDQTTIYAYAHLYGSSSETGTYDFKHVVESLCNGTGLPEIEGLIVGYRQADTNFGDYSLYGYTSVPGFTATVGPPGGTSPSEGALLNVFNGGGYETESSELTTVFSGLSGTPAATSEVPLSKVISAYTLADVGIPTSGAALGAYSITSNYGDAGLFGWQLFVPTEY